MDDADDLSWNVLIDANTHYDVGTVLKASGADVLHVTEVFKDGTDDDSIDQYARHDGRIIIGHDERFLQAIQQRLYQFDIPVSSGYGRIMLQGRESNQPDRVKQVLPFLRICYRWALKTNRRFLVTIGDNWIRYDDRLITRTPRR